MAGNVSVRGLYSYFFPLSTLAGDATEAGRRVPLQVVEELTRGQHRRLLESQQPLDRGDTGPRPGAVPAQDGRPLDRAAQHAMPLRDVPCGEIEVGRAAQEGELEAVLEGVADQPAIWAAQGDEAVAEAAAEEA